MYLRKKIFKLILNIKLYIILFKKVQMFVIMSLDLITVNIIKKIDSNMSIVMILHACTSCIINQSIIDMILKFQRLNKLNK